MFININNDYFNLDNIKGFKIFEPMKLKLYFIDGTSKTIDEGLTQQAIDALISLILGDDVEEY